LKNLFYILVLLFSADLFSAENAFCEKLEKVFGHTKKNHKYDEYHCDSKLFQFQHKTAYVVFLHRDFFDVSTFDLAIVSNLKEFKILAVLDSKFKLEPFGEHFLEFTKNEFDLGKLGKSFSIKSVRHGCGAGGSLCGDENVNIFVVKKDKIKRVLFTQIGFSALYGGEWHEDGTREHIPEDWTSNLCLETKVNPPRLIKTLDQNKKKIQNYKFNEKDFEYQTRDKNIMTSVLD
jgi:hypothetical protein